MYILYKENLVSTPAEGYSTANVSNKVITSSLKQPVPVSWNQESIILSDGLMKTREVIALKKLNPQNLSVCLRHGVTPLNPITPRRYTLTHSDTTAELFLIIGRHYAYDKIGAMRDEVRAKWVFIDNQYELYVYVYVGGPFGKNIAAVRHRIFVKELPLALEALYYGDRPFFRNHAPLDFPPIWVHFESVYPEFNHAEFLGMPEQYH